jgi:hypothetical protein
MPRLVRGEPISRLQRKQKPDEPFSHAVRMGGGGYTPAANTSDIAHRVSKLVCQHRKKCAQNASGQDWRERSLAAIEI